MRHTHYFSILVQGQYGKNETRGTCNVIPLYSSSSADYETVHVQYYSIHDTVSLNRHIEMARDL